jgi:hypothetical protein
MIKLASMLLCDYPLSSDILNQAWRDQERNITGENLRKGPDEGKFVREVF